jgi:HEAT repeat protein
MRLGFCAVLLIFLLGPVLLPLALGADSVPAAAEEQPLKAAGLATDGASLVEFFHQRAQPGADLGRVRSLIRQLGEASSEARGRASADLVTIGTPAVPLLRQAEKDLDNADVAERARRCREAIEDPSLPSAAARLLAERKPEGAAEALLAFLPLAEDEVVAQEVESALALVALRSGRPEKAVLAALGDAQPVRRAAAAAALCRAGGVGQAGLVRRLLVDPKPMVRLRAALALGELHDEAAVPVLIALLDELPLARARAAEEFLIRLAGERAPAKRWATDNSSSKKRREAWAAWWAATDAAELLDFLRKRTLSDQERDKIQALIRRLGDGEFPLRQKASDDLIALGSSAVPLLLHVAKSGDAELEVRERADECLKRLQKNTDGTAAATVARLLGFRKPDGAAEVLLHYLPWADSEETARAAQEALNALVAGNKPDALLLQALDGSSPILRAAAGEALCRSGAEGRRATHRLLKDREPAVRLRAALALASYQEPDVIPVLIALLGELPSSDGWQAEAVLRRLADRQAPAEDLGRDDAARQKCRDAWSEWWRTHGPTASLDRLDGPPRLLGHTLITQVDVNGTSGRVSELDAGGRLRWQIAELRYPSDVRGLPGDRVLLAEVQAMQVTERDFNGKILWRVHVPNLLGCRRLANGNTFIVARDQLLEVDRRNREVFSHRRPTFDLIAADKLADGQIVCLLATGRCLRLDPAGKEETSIEVGPTSGGTVEGLPNGQLLVAQANLNKVTEFDAQGKLVWEITIPTPISATRLLNGHTLVACQNFRVAELDRAGKVVWEYKTDGRPLCARRR